MEYPAIKIHGYFNGIYAWGDGFKSIDIYNKWNTFWNNFKNRCFWKYSKGDPYGGCGHLSSMDGSIYLHPMDFTAVLVSTSGCSNIYYDKEDKDRVYDTAFASTIRELKEICDECAQYCGGTFTLYISNEFEIRNTDRLKEFDLDNKEDFAKEFGRLKIKNERY